MNTNTSGPSFFVKTDTELQGFYAAPLPSFTAEICITSKPYNNNWYDKMKKKLRFQKQRIIQWFYRSPKFLKFMAWLADRRIRKEAERIRRKHSNYQISLNIIPDA